MTKTRNSFIAIALASIAFATQTWADFTVTAPANTLPAGAEITLARHDVDQRSTTRLLTAKTEADGSLSLKVAADAGIFIFKINDSIEKTLAAASGETIELSMTAGTLATKGSPGTDILARYESFRKESLARLVYPVRSDISAAKARSASIDEIVQLTQAEVDAYQTHVRELNDFVIENAGSSMALYGMSLRLTGDYRLPELAALVDSFAQQHGDIAASRSLQKRIQIFNQTAIGSIAPDLIANNLSGITEKLSDYRGRYVLVDFWASWCPPCRLENQHYAKLVERTNSAQFTLFAVNLDTVKKSWSRAVNRDKADWVHLSDLQGWTSPLAAAYGVNALPASFLLDPDGKIVAKNLRGPVLDAKLTELGLL